MHCQSLLPWAAAKIYCHPWGRKYLSLVKSLCKMHTVSVISHAEKMEIFFPTHFMITRGMNTSSWWWSWSNLTYTSSKRHGWKEMSLTKSSMDTMFSATMEGSKITTSVVLQSSYHLATTKAGKLQELHHQSQPTQMTNLQDDSLVSTLNWQVMIVGKTGIRETRKQATCSHPCLCLSSMHKNWQ